MKSPELEFSKINIPTAWQFIETVTFPLISTDGIKFGISYGRVYKMGNGKKCRLYYFDYKDRWGIVTKPTETIYNL